MIHLPFKCRFSFSRHTAAFGLSIWGSSAAVVVLMPLCAWSATNATPLTVTLAPIASAFLDVQQTKGAFLSVAPTGHVIRADDMSPLLCMAVLSNESTDSVTIHSPVADLLGYYAVQLEFTKGDSVFRRDRGGVDVATIRANRLDMSRVTFRALRTLNGGDSVAIPITVSDFWPAELGHIYRAPSNTMVRAIYRLHDPQDEKNSIDIFSQPVTLKKLLTDRVGTYDSPVTAVESENSSGVGDRR